MLGKSLQNGKIRCKFEGGKHKDADCPLTACFRDGKYFAGLSWETILRFLLIFNFFRLLAKY